MSNKDEETSRIGAAPMRPLDFLHFANDQDGEGVEFCSDDVDWNSTTQQIDWERATPTKFRIAISGNDDEEDDVPFDEPPPPPGIAEGVEIKLSNYEAHSPCYDTRSIHSPKRAAIAHPIAVDSSVVPSKKLSREDTNVSTSQTVNSSVFFPEDVSMEEEDDDGPAYDYSKTPSPLLSPTRRRRNLLLFLGIILTCLVLVIVGIFLTVGKDSSTPGDPNDTNAGSDGNTTVTESPVATPTTLPPAASPTTAAPSPSPVQDDDDDTADDEFPDMTYRPGLLTVQENGMILSQGLKSRQLARTGQFVTFSNGQNSTIPFHIRPDGAATFAVPDDRKENKGGWVYVSNSEGKELGSGGVAALTFDKNGNVIGYRNLLNRTTMNCSGGRTPWNTWVSCEEWASTGQIYQIDPFGERAPEKTSIGLIQGGRYEAFTYDDRIRDQPVFYATEDQRNGPTRRWRPAVVDWNIDPWNMLHGEGKLDYLVLTPNATNELKTGTYEWVDSVHQARANAFVTYPSAEGIDRHENFLYMACKREKMLYILDLDTNKYVRYSLEIALFDGEPDTVSRVLNDTNEIMYFNEDLGNISGIHARNPLGQLFTILEGPDWSNEVTGIAFSPSGHHMYFCFQEDGVMFEVTREDGYPFTAKTLNVRYHNNPVESLWSRRLRLR